MAARPERMVAQFLLTDAEVEEFRALAREHAGADLTSSEAGTVATQLLRVLSIIREVANQGSSASASSVDEAPLTESTGRGITTFSSA